MRAPRTIHGRLANGIHARIHISDGRVAEVEYGAPGPPGVMMAPGLIDLQVNGCAGIDVNGDDIDASRIAELTHAQWQRGVARYCPTVVSASEDRIVAALRAVARARELDPLVRRAIAGVHVEGPHISPEDGPRGAHDRDQIRPPDLAEFQRWQKSSGNVVRIVTVAPELPGAIDYIAAVARAGVLVAIGHTAASPGDITLACDAGACLSTHLGNGIHPVLPRHPNPIWSQLSEDRLTASFIADGHHLPASTLMAMVRAKSPQRSFLVSDSTRLTGCPPGQYHEPVGGAVVLHPDGKLTLAESSAMAGSARSLDQCVGWASAQLDIGLTGALEMASDTPARLLGLRRAAGFEVGAPADVTFFRYDTTAGFTPTATMIGGIVVAGDPHDSTPSEDLHA